MRRGLWAVGALVMLIGCSAKVLTVGAGPAPAAPSTGDGGGNPGTSGSSATVWTGYLENSKLPSGSDVVSMTLTIAADGTVTGTTLFGGLPLLSAPTDPDVGYPPGSVQNDFLPYLNQPDHFEFKIANGTLAGTRLTFSLDETQVWAQWCALQTKTYGWYNVVSDAGVDDAASLLGYSCLPNAGVSETSGVCTLDTPAPMTVACDKIPLCNVPPGIGPCTCTATGCSWMSDPNHGGYTFDMQVTANAIDGTVNGLPNGDANVHFTKGS